MKYRLDLDGKEWSEVTVTETVLPGLELTGQYNGSLISRLSIPLWTLLLRSAALCNIRGVCDSQKSGGEWGTF